MSKRQKNTRKKIDEDDLDETPSAVGNKPTKRIPMSFDEEDDDSKIFNVKKSKQSKRLKKSINQAPDIIHLMAMEKNIVATASGVSYSEKALQELRESQKFKATPIIGVSEELRVTDVVAVTDELLEELSDAEVVSWPQPLIISEGTVPLIPTREEIKEDEIAWEDQLAARGGIKLDSRSARVDHTESKRRDMRRSLLSTQQSLEKNLQSLRECCGRQSKQIAANQAALSSLKSEKLLTEELFNLKNSDLTFQKVVALVLSGLTICRIFDSTFLMLLGC
jgi:hypothetical protein